MEEEEEEEAEAEEEEAEEKIRLKQYVSLRSKWRHNNKYHFSSCYSQMPKMACKKRRI